MSNSDSEICPKCGKYNGSFHECYLYYILEQDPLDTTRPDEDSDQYMAYGYCMEDAIQNWVKDHDPDWDYAYIKDQHYIFVKSPESEELTRFHILGEMEPTYWVSKE